jgi:hypothetical protein
MDVRPRPVLLVFLLQAVIVAMGQEIVVVLMSVPVGAVLPLVERVVRMVVCDVIMVMGVYPRLVSVLRLASVSLRKLAFGPGRLRLHASDPRTSQPSVLRDL